MHSAWSRYHLGGGGGTPHNFFFRGRGRVWSSVFQTLTMLQTKTCHQWQLDIIPRGGVLHVIFFWRGVWLSSPSLDYVADQHMSFSGTLNPVSDLVCRIHTSSFFNAYQFPDFQNKMVKIYTLFQTKRTKKPYTLMSHIHVCPYRAY